MEKFEGLTRNQLERADEDGRLGAYWATSICVSWAALVGEFSRAEQSTENSAIFATDPDGKLNIRKGKDVSVYNAPTGWRRTAALVAGGLVLGAGIVGIVYANTTAGTQLAACTGGSPELKLYCVSDAPAKRIDRLRKLMLQQKQQISGEFSPVILRIKRF